MAPVVLLAIYLYLHLYLQTLWETLISLPAVFPDGRRLDRRAYPWLLTSLIRAHVPRLRGLPQTFSSVRIAASFIMAWGLVPFTIALFWGRYLPTHDWFGITILSAALLLSIWAAAAFYYRARTTLRSEVQFPRR